jgi:DNA-binding beta-propeller fold protein YncE
MAFSAIVTVTLLLVVALSTTATAAPTGNITRIADGFAWLENLWFDGDGGLYASELWEGRLWRWTRDPATGVVNKTLWISGWERVYGIAASPYPKTILVVAVYNATASGLSIVSTERPQNHTRLAWTPKPGNGLAYNPRTGWVYTCNEGDFIPLLSEMMATNALTGGLNSDDTATVFQDEMIAADGAFIDVAGQQLYVTSSVLAEIYVYDVHNASTAGTSTHTFSHQYHAPGFWSLDDLCVSRDLPRGVRPRGDATPFIFAADFIAGAVRSFNASGAGDSTTWAGGFHAVTSVRQGRGRGWEGNSVFVTEGGTTNKSKTDRGLWEVHLA